MFLYVLLNNKKTIVLRNIFPSVKVCVPSLKTHTWLEPDCTPKLKL